MHESGHYKLRAPVGKQPQIKVINRTQAIVLVLVILFQHIGVVDVTRTVLSREVGEKPIGARCKATRTSSSVTFGVNFLSRIASK